MLKRYSDGYSPETEGKGKEREVREAVLHRDACCFAGMHRKTRQITGMFVSTGKFSKCCKEESHLGECSVGWRTFCLQDQMRHSQHCVSFSVVRDTDAEVCLFPWRPHSGVL